MSSRGRNRERKYIYLYRIIELILLFSVRFGDYIQHYIFSVIFDYVSIYIVKTTRRKKIYNTINGSYIYCIHITYLPTNKTVPSYHVEKICIKRGFILHSFFYLVSPSFYAPPSHNFQTSKHKHTHNCYIYNWIECVWNGEQLTICLRRTWFFFYIFHWHISCNRGL